MNARVPGRKTSLALISVMAFLVFAPLGICLADMEIFGIQFREASDLLPLVKTMLSDEGRATVDIRTNSIFVTDGRESLDRIRELLKGFDTPVPQVRIRFKFEEESLSKNRDISASGGVSGKGWSVSAGKAKRDGVRVRARDGKGTQERYSESFITVLSGSAAYISVGKEIPFTDRWVDLSRRYARYGQRVSFKKIETGMEVRPIVAGERVNIEITPRVSYEEAGKRGVIRFTEASTRLVVTRGRWVSLGGHSKESNEVIRQILSRRSARDNTDVSLSLMVEP